MKNLKFMTYTCDEIVWEISHRRKEFVDEWFEFWFGEEAQK